MSQEDENPPVNGSPPEPSANPEQTPPTPAVPGNSGSFWFEHPTISALARFVVFVILVRYIFVPVAFALVRPYRRALENWVGDIGEALLLGCVLLGTFLMARLERRSFFDYGLRERRVFPNLGLGMLLGFVSLSTMLLALNVGGDFSFGPQAMHGRALLGAALSNVIGFALVASLEETAFRGYTLYTLAEGIRFWPAAVLMSLLFAWEHTGNSGETKVGIIAVFAFGIVLAFSIWQTGSLLWAIGFHFMWDYSETFIYGVPDSGFVSPQHLLSAHFTGPVWITGGSVGPEGSYFIFLVLAAVAGTIYVLYPQRQSPLMPERAGTEKEVN